MNSPERKALAALFFIFGFAMIAWVPRLPGIKANLNLSNGQFGTIISLGAVGSILSLLTMGHLVHRYGSGRALLLSSTLLFGSISLLGRMTSIWQFIVIIIVFGGSVSAFSISLNVQAFHEQESDGANLVPRMHGAWSAGALLTVILSGFIAGRVSLAVHLDVVAALGYMMTLTVIHKFKASFMVGSVSADRSFSIRTPFTSFRINWIIALGLLGAGGIEQAIGDWTTVFSKQELHMGVGISTLPYLLFVVAMITGRLSVHRLAEYVSIDRLVKLFPIAGGITFIACTNLGAYIGKSHPMVGFALVIAGTFAAGLGLSFLTPTFIDSANRLTSVPGGIVLSQLSLVNAIAVFLLKAVIAWTAQVASIAVALTFPSLLLIAASFTSSTIRKAHS
jgi:MFS family permease